MYLTEEEELKRTAMLGGECFKIANWMSNNFDKIFAATPEKYAYAVGVVEKISKDNFPTICYPTVYYFKHRDKEALPFFAASQEKGKGAHCIWRGQRDSEVTY